jgi:ClpP class serine protease
MKPATRAFNALTAEMWAIEPSWLPILAAIAQRNQPLSDVEVAREWVKRDHLLMAGPGAQKLAGTYRSYLVNGIGMLPVTGPIFPRANLLTEMSGATSITMLQNDHRAMLDNSEVKAIMMLVDSPGGAVSGIANFALQVAAGARKKETTAYALGTMTSAAYWIASAATRISVDRTAVLGSIGVAAMIPKQVGPDQDGMIGVEVVSSNAPNKRPDPQLDDGVSVIRATLDSIEKIFINDVARMRGVTPTKVINDFGKGGVLIGSAAVSAGMADAVESQQAAMNALQLNILRSPGKGRTAGDQNYQRLVALKARHPSQESNQDRLNRLRVASLRSR